METVMRIPLTDDIIRPQMLQLRDFRPFKTSDEYLWAMKEDLSDWLNILYPDLNISATSFMESLETGVTLCKHANNVRRAYADWVGGGRKLPKCWGHEWKLPAGEVTFNPNARPETFFARDNVHNFITWCRKLGIFECLLFESDDLILRKNEKNVILCLLEVARRGSHFGMATPLLVQFEKEIDRDIAKDTGVDLSSSGEEEESLLEYGPRPQIITNDLRSLDEMVRELVKKCSCPTQFPMIRVAEGKYRIGDTKVMIYVRILRNHVMVRVGGGWDTLAHYLDKHDPCRCSSGHRAAVSSRLTMKNEGVTPRMKVEYERRDLSFDSHTGHPSPSFQSNKKPVDLSDSGSEISDEGYKTSDNTKLCIDSQGTPRIISNIAAGRGHNSRKTSVVRTRSMSTDEDRPDSRSTDEDLVPVRKENSVQKSHSTTQVPYSRSMSSDRSKGSAILSNRSRYTSGEGSRTPLPSRSQLSKHVLDSSTGSGSAKSKITTPGRSLSASGTAEFFGRNKSYGVSSGQKVVKGASSNNSANLLGRSTAPNSSVRTSGKNTWNGYSTGPRPRNRPNLFQQDVFSGRNTQKPSCEYEAGDSNEVVAYPDLAACIKRALELDSDQDKISHIELVIQQYEKKKGGELSPTLSDREAISLPFVSPLDQSLSPKSITISKRKENGMTKIPKPNFY